MMFNTQKRQMVLAISVAVIAAIGLAVSVTYAFSIPRGPTINLGSIDCTKTNPPMLNLPAGSTLREDGTEVINGTTFWYVSFIQGNLTTVYFHGVQFAFNEVAYDSINSSIGAQITSKEVDLTTKVSPTGIYCGYTLPQITITFPSGSVVVYNKETVAITALGANITYDTPSSNPWFTQHISPQAGVGYQTNGGKITLYVSTS